MAEKTMPPISVAKWVLKVVVIYLAFFLMLSWPVADGLGWRDQSMANNIIGIGHHSLMMVFAWYMVGGVSRGTFYYILRGTPHWPGGRIAEKHKNQESQ